MKELEYDRIFKLLLVGDARVGKSALLKRYVDELFSDKYQFTIGVDFSIRTIQVGNKTIKLQIWDTAGAERYRTITSSYYRGSHGILIVYDVTSRESFGNISQWMQEIDRHATKGVKILLLGNKIDKLSEIVVKNKDAKEFADRLGIGLIETSAKEGWNVDIAFSTMAQRLTEDMGIAPLKNEANTRTGQVQAEKDILVTLQAQPILVSRLDSRSEPELTPISDIHRPASADPKATQPTVEGQTSKFEERQKLPEPLPAEPYERPKSVPIEDLAAKKKQSRMTIELHCGSVNIVAVAVLDTGADDDWVSRRMITRLEEKNRGAIVKSTLGACPPTFTDFSGNSKIPDGMIEGTWRMLTHNPDLMYDSVFYVNDNPNVPFDVLIGSETLFGKGILSFGPALRGALPLIFKPLPLDQKMKIEQGKARESEEAEKLDAWRLQQEEEEDKARFQSSSKNSISTSVTSLSFSSN